MAKSQTTPAQQAVYAVLAKASCTEPHVYDGEARIIPWLVRVDGMVDIRKVVSAVLEGLSDHD